MQSPQDRQTALLALVLEKPESERAAFLHAVCGDDTELRRQLELQLATQEQPATLLDPGSGTLDPAARGFEDPSDEAVGQMLGRYKLLERIGEGGCGVVYVAEQTEPVRRRVALKVIKLGMDTKEVVARFEAERQALAMMDHPNIARVLDGGMTQRPTLPPASAGPNASTSGTAGIDTTHLPAGRPYFVMELVRGVRITEYCDQANLSMGERIELFIKVCQAIQHAHQKGIIHRDIKPSNILVTLHDHRPEPKVIDFGIAKATEGRLTDSTLYTQLHQFIGTPAYMSPEQAEMGGLDIDTRSDIYSLGVVLYELLAGTTPFDGRDLIASGLDQMRKTIREREPLRPSTRLANLKTDELTTTAKRRSTDRSRLLRQLQGDLDWIVIKCLEKDRQSRYDTANGLAADLRRYLNNEPVTARPPSAVYRLQKAFRRNKLAFAAIGAVAVTFMAGALVSVWQAMRARQEAKRALQAEAVAQQQLTESEAISKFLVKIFESPDPQRDGSTITLAETLRAAAKQLDAETAIDPEHRVGLQATLATTFYGLGLHAEATKLRETVRDFYLNRRGREHPETITAMTRLAGSYGAAGRNAEAITLGEETLQLAKSVNGPEHTNTLTAMNDLGIAYGESMRGPESLQLLETVVNLRRKVNGPDHTDTLGSLNNLALFSMRSGRTEEGLKMLESIADQRRNTAGLKHHETLTAMHNLAFAYATLGRGEEAIRLREEVLRLRLEVLGPDHPKSLASMTELAQQYAAAGRSDDARQLIQKSLASARTVHAASPTTLAGALTKAMSASATLGDFDDVITVAQEAIRASPDTLKNAYFVLARALMHRERYSEAVPVLSRAKARFAGNPDRLAQFDFWSRLATASQGQEGHRATAAQALLERKVEELRQSVAARPEDTGLLKDLANLHLWRGDTNEHLALCRRLFAIAATTREGPANERAVAAYLIRPQPDPALLKEAVAAAGRAAAATDGEKHWILLSGAFAAYRDGRFAEAADLATRVLEIAYDNNSLRGNALAFRAMARWRAAQAEAAHGDLAELARRIPPSTHRSPLAPVVLDPNGMTMVMAYEEARALIQGAAPGAP